MDAVKRRCVFFFFLGFLVLSCFWSASALAETYSPLHGDFGPAEGDYDYFQVLRSSSSAYDDPDPISHYRVLLPPGTVKVRTFAIRAVNDSEMKAAVHFGGPPKNHADPSTQTPNENLSISYMRDNYIYGVSPPGDGDVITFSDYISPAITEDNWGWIYVKTFNEPEGYLLAEKYTIKVDSNIYNKWREKWSWSDIEAYGTASKPLAVDVTPVQESGEEWTNSSVQLTASCMNADKIYYTMTNDGTQSDDPDENDNAITGSSGAIRIQGNSNTNSTVRVKFRGWNQEKGLGPVSANSYVLNLTAQHPDTVQGILSDETTYHFSPLSMNVTANGATHVYAYNATNISDYEPDAFDATTIDKISVQTGSGTFDTLTGDRDKIKTYKNIRFRAWNEYAANDDSVDEFGDWSEIKDYTIDYTQPAPGDLVISKSGRKITVESSYAASLGYSYKIAYGGNTPPEPSNDPDQTSWEHNLNDDFQTVFDISGLLDSSKLNTISLRFFAKNDVGQVSSEVKTYTFDYSSTDTGGSSGGSTGGSDDGTTDRSFEDYFSDLLNGSATGSLKITILPEQAVKNGAKWRLSKQAWQDSGQTISDVGVGQQVIEFSKAEGFKSPDSITVQITENTTQTSTVRYMVQEGTAKTQPSFTLTDVVQPAGGGEGVDLQAPILETSDGKPLCLQEVLQNCLQPGAEQPSIQVAQNQSGILTLSDSENGGWEIPVRVKSMDTTSKEDGLFINRNGEAVFIQNGLAVTLYPAPDDKEAFANALSNVDLGLDDDGTVSVYGGDGDLHLRFGYTATTQSGLKPQADGSLGIRMNHNLVPLDAFCGVIQVVYPNGNVQDMPPYVHDTKVLTEVLNKNNLSYKINFSNGVITVLRDGAPIWKGVPCYKLQPNQAGGGGTIQPAGDVNGDGTPDFLLVSDEGTQVLYTIP